MDPKGNKKPSKPPDKTKPSSSENSTIPLSQKQSKDGEGSKKNAVPPIQTPSQSKDKVDSKANEKPSKNTQTQSKEKVASNKVNMKEQSAGPNESRGFWSTLTFILNFLLSILLYPFRRLYQFILSFYETPESPLETHVPDVILCDCSHPSSSVSCDCIKPIKSKCDKNCTGVQRSTSNESSIEENESHIGLSTRLYQMLMWFITPQCINCSNETTGYCLNSDLSPRSTPKICDRISTHPVLYMSKTILNILHMNCNQTSNPCECDARKILLMILFILVWIGFQPGNMCD